ncbi:MAG: hypothetical protein KDA92_17490 [Planctomycetales bacterium]|nr:hypothetical protein [Planctomycetales bacterium]
MTNSRRQLQMNYRAATAAQVCVPKPFERFALWFAARLLQTLVARRQPIELRSVVARMFSKLALLPHGYAQAAPVFAAHTQLRLATVEHELDRLLDGRLVFESTETWHRAYQEVLDGVQVRRYLSVALIKSDDYWHDTPSECSLQFNATMVQHGFLVHRVFIIDEFFWPRHCREPNLHLLHWMSLQKQAGLDVSLIRREDLAHEPHLVGDFGIYGDDAVGYQETDFEGRTVRYELRFDAASLRRAEQHWRELLLYAKPWRDLFS